MSSTFISIYVWSNLKKICPEFIKYLSTSMFYLGDLVKPQLFYTRTYKCNDEKLFEELEMKYSISLFRSQSLFGSQSSVIFGIFQVVSNIILITHYYLHRILNTMLCSLIISQETPLKKRIIHKRKWVKRSGWKIAGGINFTLAYQAG